MPYKDPEKNRAYLKAWRQANPERIKKYHNAPKACAARKAYYQAHKEEFHQRIKKWREAHPEKLRAQRRKYRLAHREQRRIWQLSWRRQNPERSKDYYLRCVFGITLAEYRAIAKDQGGRCAICGKREYRKHRGRTRRLAVDHDEATGTVRGLLCADCNTALGLFKHQPSSLRSAAQYLECHLSKP